MKKTLFFLLISSLVIFSTQSRLIIPRPQPLSSLKQDEGNCSYAVNIRTSCSSPPITQDNISLRFGDADGNEIFAPNLDDPQSGRFRRCTLDAYLIYGPCMNPTMCYLLLNRSGNDGWIPLEVIIIERQGRWDNFFFDVPLPNNTWFGYYNCFGAKAESLAVK